ncbi:MAG TPA: hypothetical protein PLJ15_02670 [Candidatus Omnitrophota bacterium]|jgi:hypothetical protein|nr:hypothetical protein [Candidatus Omnitrophota bacterium]
MVKIKINALYRIKHLFLHHPWLKIISLILAIISWLYIKYEMLVG